MLSEQVWSKCRSGPGRVVSQDAGGGAGVLAPGAGGRGWGEGGAAGRISGLGAAKEVGLILVLPPALFSSPICISIFYWITMLFNHLVPVPGILLPSCLTHIRHLSVKFLPKQDELDKAISFPHIFQTMPRMLPPAIPAQLLRRKLPSFSLPQSRYLLLFFSIFPLHGSESLSFSHT